MKLQIFSLLLCLIGTTGLIAQNYQTITGRIIDQKTNRPISYANIGVLDKGIGTTSGGNGQFTLKVPNRYRSETLQVSVLGYKDFKQALPSVKSPITIRLQPTSYDLLEVEVMDESTVEDIIRKAVANIPQNYPMKPTNVLGFYRESRTDENNEYMYMAEGVLNIYKNTYKNDEEGMVGLVQGRKINLRDPLDTNVISIFSSGHMAAHRFDFVKNRIEFIQEDFFPAYEYRLESVTTYNDKPVYVISFGEDKNYNGSKTHKRSQFDGLLGMFFKKEERVQARMKGRLYIEKDSYAFVRAEFEITEEGLKRFDDYPLYAGRWTYNRYVVNYRELGGTWYFNDALREGGRYSGGVYTNEIKITDIRPGKGEPIPYLERMHRGETFVEMTGRYDEDFWKSYNVTPLSEELAESVQQLQNSQKAQEVFDPEIMQSLQELRDSTRLARDLAAAETEARERNVDDAGNAKINNDETIFGEPGVQQINPRNSTGLSPIFGLGTHIISTPATNLGISYLDEVGDAIVSAENNLSSKDFEVVGIFGIDIYTKKNWILRWNTIMDFGKNIQRETAFGFGRRFNLSKQRPVLLKLAAEYSRLRYARRIGTADNDYGDFKVDGKKFKADEIDLFYGFRTHNLRLTADFAVELRPSQEIYVRGSYYFPFAERQEVHFRETGELFKKKEHIDADTDFLAITRDDQPFKDRLANEGNFVITVGFLFK